MREIEVFLGLRMSIFRAKNGLIRLENAYFWYEIH